MSEGPDRHVRRGWLVAGSLLGLVFSPPAAPYRRALLARALRLRTTGPDPVAPFREAPCYAYDESGALQPTDGAEVAP